MTKTVAQHIIDTLMENNFNQLYCIPGMQNDDFFDTLYDYQDKLKPIHTRHEQGASYMALGAALATGKPQAFFLVPGPGFLNGTAALATAYSTNAPVLAMIGHIPSGAIGKGFGFLHDIPNQTDMLSNLTKHTASLRSGKNAKAKINAVFSALQSGHPLPVGLEVPVDVWKQQVTDSDADIPIVQTRIPVDSNHVQQAIDLIKSAKNPMIIVGGGAQGSSDSVTKLATLINAPVSAFRMGHGVLSCRESLSIKTNVAHALWSDVDVVIALGTRLQQQRLFFGMDDNMKILHIDSNDAELTRYDDYPPTVAIHADLQDALPEILVGLEGHDFDRPQWLQKIAQVKRDETAKMEKDIAPQVAYVRAIRNALPDDGILVDEMTQISYVSRIAYPTYKPRTFISTGYQGNLGWGVATGLGAAHACRDVPVVSINGDGGFMFTMPELATAVRHNIPLNIIVFNDSFFGNVRRYQLEVYNNRPIATDLANPDFVALAESFGIPASRVTTPEELEAQLKKNVAIDGPTFIEVPVGTFPDPWGLLRFEKVRG